MTQKNRQPHHFVASTTFTAGLISPPIFAGTALTVSPEQHSGCIIFLDDNSGGQVRLPRASGTGGRYLFQVTAASLAASYTVEEPDAASKYTGSVLQISSNAVNRREANPASTSRMRLNGAAQGGLGGDWFEIVDFGTDTYFIRGIVYATDPPSSPLTGGA